ncbi:thioesterase II family protein [Streptomyces griseoviridis]|uniref:thioesterase II family protein n=1 Tax=Streptomyces griseoviridis TaxID=45398 RepID=UPI00342E85B8
MSGGRPAGERATNGTARPAPGRWFHRPLPRPDARLRLVCVPHAGAGAAVFRPWAERLAPDVELVAVRLPGRESRLREPPARHWPTLAQDLAAALDDQVPAPYVLFGHSMGAMLVYETVRRPLARPPEKVLLSGCRAPHVPRALPAIHALPPERFLAELGRLAATPAAVLARPALMELLEPVLRADIRLAETWHHPAPDPLPVPATVFWGTTDDVAPPDAVAAWRHLAPHGFGARPVEGGHFFPFSPEDGTGHLLHLLDDETAPAATRRPRGSDRA